MEDVFIHPQALCESINVGEGTRIWAFAHILPGARIGKNCNICDGVFVENEVVIGDNVTIKCGVQVWDGITVEDNVFIGPNATLTNDMYPKSRNENWKLLHTVLRKGCSIGANATILPGIEIGEGAMIGAGAVVTKSVPAHAVIVGNPGREVETKVPPPPGSVNLMSDMPLPEPYKNDYQQAPLLSAIVFDYGSSEYIFDALHSVLTQTYPNIELIVGSMRLGGDFPADEIIDYVTKHRGNNIKRVVITENKENSGVIACLKKVHAICAGEYELFITSDDVWKYSCVFADMMTFVNTHDDEPEWIVAQVEMYNEKLKRGRLSMDADIAELLRRGDVAALRDKAVSGVILPIVGCMYKRTLFGRLGSLQGYSRLAAWPLQLRALRMNVRPFFLENVSARRRQIEDARDEFIADAAVNACENDVRGIFEREVRPYRAFFSSDAYALAGRVAARYRTAAVGLDSDADASCGSEDASSGAALNNPSHRKKSNLRMVSFRQLTKKLLLFAKNNKDAIIRFSLKREIFTSLLRGIPFLVFAWLFDRYTDVPPVLSSFLLLLGIIECGVSLLKLLLNVGVKLYYMHSYIAGKRK